MFRRLLTSQSSLGIAGAVTLLALATFLLFPNRAPVHAQGGTVPSLGGFESQSDVGQTLPGSASYDPARGIYLVTGGG
jgi:hypothetical protein